MTDERQALDEARRLLSTHPDVAEAVVWDAEGTVCAFVVPDLFASATELRGWLSDALGDAAVAVAVVAEVPDSRPAAADLVDAYGGSVYTAPASDDEAALCGLWAEVLGVTRVGAHDDLLDLGADSMKVVEVQTGIMDRWSVDVPLDDLYELATPRRVAARIAGGATATP